MSQFGLLAIKPISSLISLILQSSYLMQYTQISRYEAADTKQDNQTISVIEMTLEHCQLYEHVTNLFTRQNLRKNTYLSRQIKSAALDIPIFVIAEERKIAQVTHRLSTIMDVLQISELTEVNKDTRIVRVLEYPCLKLKFNEDSMTVFNKLSDRMQQFCDAQNQNQKDSVDIPTSKSEQQTIDSSKVETEKTCTPSEPNNYLVSYSLSKKPTEEGYYYLILQDIKLAINSIYFNKVKKPIEPLENILKQVNKELAKEKRIKYSYQQYYEDIKEGVQQRKRKFDNSNPRNHNKKVEESRGRGSNLYTGHNSYAHQNPYIGQNPYFGQHPYICNQAYPRSLPVFIRRAVLSSDEQETPSKQVRNHPKTQQDKTPATAVNKPQTTQRNQNNPNQQPEPPNQQPQNPNNQPQNPKQLDDNDFPSVS